MKIILFTSTMILLAFQSFGFVKQNLDGTITYSCRSINGPPLILNASLKYTPGNAGQLSFQLQGPGLSSLTNGAYMNYSSTIPVHVTQLTLEVYMGNFKLGDRYTNYYINLPGPRTNKVGILIKDRMTLNWNQVGFDRKDIQLNCF